MTEDLNTSPKPPNLAGTPIALGIAKAYGYEVPGRHVAYDFDELSQSCLAVTKRPITTYIMVRGLENAQS